MGYLLFLDGSTTNTGYAIYEVLVGELLLVQSGSLYINNSKLSAIQRIPKLSILLNEILEAYDIDSVYAEDVFNGPSLKVLVKLQGYLEIYFNEKDIPFNYKGYLEKQWRSVKTGVGAFVKVKGAVTKQEWFEAIKSEIEPSGEVFTNDEADAIGLGMFYAKQNDLKANIKTTKRKIYKVK